MSYSHGAVTIDRPHHGLTRSSDRKFRWFNLLEQAFSRGLLVYPNVTARDVIEKPDAIIFADDLIHPRSNVASQNQ